MRAYPLAAAAVLAAAALAPSLLSAAAPGAPARKSGWWEMTVQMSAPMPMTNRMNICVDAAEDSSAFNGQPNQRMPSECRQGPVTRTPAGWTFSNTCTMEGMTIATTGVATGDFQGNYRVESTTRMSPAPMPQMAETKTVLSGVYKGPCPSGRRPGQVW